MLPPSLPDPGVPARRPASGGPGVRGARHPGPGCPRPGSGGPPGRVPGAPAGVPGWQTPEPGKGHPAANGGGDAQWQTYLTNEM